MYVRRRPTYPNLCDWGEFNLSLLLVPKGHSEVDYLMFFKDPLLLQELFFFVAKPLVSDCL